MKNKDKVLKVFFENPTKKFYVREIARITGLNPNTILNISENLIQEKLIVKDKKKHIVELSAHINETFKQLKKIENLHALYKSCLINFLIDTYSPESITVIGSYADGNDIEKSDIDLVVITKKKTGSLNLKKFEKLLKRKVHLIVLDYDSMSDEFYTNLINGIVLHGYIRKK